MDELVKRLDRVGGDLVPVAEGVAREVDSVAFAENALGAVVRAVVAIFGNEDVGDEAGRGAEAEGWRGSRLDRCGVGIGDGDVDDTHGALDEDARGLEIETVGDDPLDLAVGGWIGGRLFVDENGLADFQMRAVAGFFVAASLGGGGFSRRSWVCGIGGGRFFCGFGIKQEFELGGIERLAFLVEELSQDQVDPLLEELVFGTQAGDLGQQFLFAFRSHLLRI